MLPASPKSSSRRSRKAMLRLHLHTHHRLCHPRRRPHELLADESPARHMCIPTHKHPGSMRRLKIRLSNARPRSSPPAPSWLPDLLASAHASTRDPLATFFASPLLFNYLPQVVLPSTIRTAATRVAISSNVGSSRLAYSAYTTHQVVIGEQDQLLLPPKGDWAYDRSSNLRRLDLYTLPPLTYCPSPSMSCRPP